MNNILKENERLDDLMIGGLYIIQDPKTFCFGMDAVLLSDFISVPDGGSIVDLCTGNGVIPLLLSAKTGAKIIKGMEIQEKIHDMADRSVRYNNISDRVEMIRGDIKEASLVLGKSVFDAVSVNPPYMIASHGLINPADEKAVARHEILCSLDDVLRQSALLLKPGGHFFMVHRPFRLAEILEKMRACRIEPKRLRMVHPFAKKEPSMILVEGIRGAKSGMRVERPLVIYETQGVYSEDVKKIYGDCCQ